MKAQLRPTVQSEVREFRFRARVARDQLELYRDSLLPYAEQSLESTRSGFESGRATFLDILDSQRALLNLRLGEVMARDELQGIGPFGTRRRHGPGLPAAHQHHH
jgi:outer membrane protein TolC